MQICYSCLSSTVTQTNLCLVWRPIALWPVTYSYQNLHVVWLETQLHADCLPVEGSGRAQQWYGRLHNRWLLRTFQTTQPHPIFCNRAQPSGALFAHAEPQPQSHYVSIIGESIHTVCIHRTWWITCGWTRSDKKTHIQCDTQEVWGEQDTQQVCHSSN